jgi:uncharacterized protein (UPF0335 family)
MNPQTWIALGAITVTVLVASITALINLSYRLGHMGARVEELEKYRVNLRSDLHEISDKLEYFGNEIRAMRTLIEERTERRIIKPKSLPPDYNPYRRREDTEE